MLGSNIKHYRELRGLTQSQLAEKLGFANQKSISTYETGTRMPPSDVLTRIADALNVSLDTLVSKEYSVSGSLPAEFQSYAISKLTKYEDVTLDMECEFFAVKIKSDVMAPRIQHGDIVIFRKQSSYNQGDTVIVLVDGEEATVKIIQSNENGLSLVPRNSNYMPRFFTWEEVEKKPVTIIGKAIELRGRL